MIRLNWRRRTGGGPPDAHRLGRRGERRAARLLTRLGHRILHRNLRLGHDEADLVTTAPDGRTLVVVEVKTRRGGDFAPEIAVDHRKRRALTRVAGRLAADPRYRDRPIRFDVVVVMWPPRNAFYGRGRPALRHFVSAFEMGG